MAEILLVNPRRRRRRRKTSSRRKRRSAPRAVRKVRRRRRRAVAVLKNPRRRRRYARAALTRRRRRRNPSFRGMGGGLVSSIKPTLKEGFIGATGAIGLDLLWGQAARFLPASIAGSAIAQYATKLFGALLVGMIGGKVLRGKGRDLAVGATTVVLHDAMKAQLQASVPSLPLGEYLTFAPTVGTMPRASRMLSTGVGEYLSGIPNDGAGGTNDDMSYTGEWNSDGMNGY